MARRGENIYKRKDGRYEGRYIKYYDITGKAVYGYIYSKNYMDLKGRLLQCKTGTATVHSGANTTLGEWMNAWLFSQETLKPTTKNVYKGHIKNHIIPAMGQIRLYKLNSELLQIFINNLNLSPSTVKTIFSILKSGLCAAQEQGFIRNIWAKVKLPKSEKSIVRILSVSEQQRLETILQEDEDIGILICLYTGMRIGELCALQWENVDFENAVIRVMGTQARTEDGIEILKPKSKSAKREIPIPPFLLDRINNIPKPGKFVLTRQGKPFDVRTYRRHFKTRLKQADLPDIKYHSLRHTFATRALEVGMDYKTLSEILGHSSVGITLDLYTHSLNEYKKKQMNKLEKIYYL